MNDKLRRPQRGEIDVYVRYKAIYDRRQAGETYPSIACDFNISVGRAREVAETWKDILESHEEYLVNWQQHLTGNRFNDKRVREYVAKLNRLVAAGLLGNGKRSPEYGYA